MASAGSEGKEAYPLKYGEVCSEAENKADFCASFATIDRLRSNRLLVPMNPEAVLAHAWCRPRAEWCPALL